MLRWLEISNYGLIERAEIQFSDGATIFTGETGSGKTMLLGAIAFALGARASADVVRRGAGKASVTLAFEPNASLLSRFDADGFEIDPGEEATIVREVTDAGKSSVRVNGRACTAGYVREIADHVAEIVGQHEAQRLLTPAYHLELLDRYAGTAAEQAKAAVSLAHEVHADRVRALAALQGDERKALERYEDAAFAVNEIEGAAPHVGEDDRLTERRRYLDNVERIASALRAAHEALGGDDESATSALGAASVALSGIANIGGNLREMSERATALQSEASELATQISRELDVTEFDPAELETINARLDALDRLKRKYGASIERVLEHADQLRSVVRDFESRDERTAELSAEVAVARRELENAAAELTKLRAQAAKKFAKGVVEELKDLALASARFDVAFTTLAAISADGAETAEFVFAANAGEAVRPLIRVASGGELSRVLLAIVVALAGNRERTALVFDEIDAGIGGATATAVGVRLGQLAREGQVVCVTHLAQLATWADLHYVLDKTEARGATTISVREISGDDQRTGELARMLSGESHDEALAHARTLLRAVAR